MVGIRTTTSVSHDYLCCRFMWFRRKRRSSVTKHYLMHKELARAYIRERVLYWNSFYGFTFGRIAIKNQKTCWGSCSEHGNLNFNYKLIFIPEDLIDYVIVHELCHLAELNHSPRFWELVEKTQPAYKDARKRLRTIRSVPHNKKPTVLSGL